MEMEIYELLNDDLESKRNLQEAIALLKLKTPNELDTFFSEDGGGDAPYERKRILLPYSYILAYFTSIFKTYQRILLESELEGSDR